MAKARIYQLIDDEASRDKVDPAFQPLYRRTTERPDWSEYAVIRKILRETPPVEDEMVGFLDMQFTEATQVSPREVVEFIGMVGEFYDVVGFSPYPDLHALFWNVFEVGDYQVPGNATLAQDTVRAMGLELDLTELVMDSRNSLFRNYFAARRSFWDKWLTLADKFVEVADAQANPLHSRLTALLPPAMRRPGQPAPQVKLMLMEHLASLALVTNPQLKSAAYQPFQRPRTASPFAEHPLEAVLSDALKIAFNVRGDPVYRAAFAHIREQVKQALDKKMGSPS